MTRLSSMRTRRKPLSMAFFSTSISAAGSRAGFAVFMACARMPGERVRTASGRIGGRRDGSAVANSSSKLSMSILSTVAYAAARRDFLVHRAQLVVQIIRREIHAVVPRDGRKAIVEVEIGEAARVAQRLEVLPVEVVGKIDHAFASIVEFQPDLVVSEIPRF